VSPKNRDAAPPLEIILSFSIFNLKGDVKKLNDFTPEYRLRVGKYRVLFEIDKDKIVIYRVKHRKYSYQ